MTRPTIIFNYSETLKQLRSFEKKEVSDLILNYLANGKVRIIFDENALWLKENQFDIIKNLIIGADLSEIECESICKNLVIYSCDGCEKFLPHVNLSGDLELQEEVGYPKSLSNDEVIKINEALKVELNEHPNLNKYYLKHHLSLDGRNILRIRIMVEDLQSVTMLNSFNSLKKIWRRNSRPT